MHSDRFRTTINVMCDALGTIIVNHLSRFDLAAEVSCVRLIMCAQEWFLVLRNKCIVVCILRLKLL